MSGVEVDNLGSKLGMLSSPKREGRITFGFLLDREGDGGVVGEVTGAVKVTNIRRKKLHK